MNAMPSYSRYRCGLTFEDVRRELMTEQAAAKARGEYMFVTRKTVLGRMHQYKRHAYEFESRERCKS